MTGPQARQDDGPTPAEGRWVLLASAALLLAVCTTYVDCAPVAAREVEAGGR